MGRERETEERGREGEENSKFKKENTEMGLDTISKTVDNDKNGAQVAKFYKRIDIILMLPQKLGLGKNDRPFRQEVRALCRNIPPGPILMVLTGYHRGKGAAFLKQQGHSLL